MALEQQIQNSILDWLAVKRIWCRRMNTGAIKTDKRFFRFGSPGMADILATPVSTSLRDGEFETKVLTPIVLWIEVKAPRGKQSESQMAFQREVEAWGHWYVVAKSIDDVEAFLKTKGII